jgi:alpha-beta hydrolase superfamily lysophospholipase
MIRSLVDAGRRVAPRRQLGWRAALFAPLLLLATCQPTADPEISFAGLAPPHSDAEASGPARFTDGAFIADDGARLPLRKWLPRGPVAAVILALHGFGDYSHAFEMPAQMWAPRGIATYAFDQRGFGAAPGHGLWAGGERLVADAIAASRILRQTYPDRPLYLFGESMGGAVTMLAASGERRGAVAGPSAMPVAEADGLILSAPAVWGRETMDLLPKLLLFAGVRLFPEMILTGRGLRILASDNLPMLRALGRDPLVWKGTRIDAIYGLVDLMDDALAAAPHLDRPMLLLYGANDQIVPPRPIADLVEHLPPDPGHRRRLAYYPKGYHLLLRDLDRATVVEDVASWVRDRTRPLPSGADATAKAKPWPPPAKPDAVRAMSLAPGDARR